MFLQFLSFVCFGSLLAVAFVELRKIANPSLPFALWGAICFGFIGLSSALLTAGIFLPELTNSALFALSGALLSVGVFFGSSTTLESKKGAKGMLVGAIYLILTSLTIIGFFSESWSFPILMMVGYFPLVLLASRAINIENLAVAALWGIATLSAGSMIMVVAIPNLFFGACRFDKCSVWGQSIGTASSGNAFGLMLSALGVLGVLFSSSSSRKVIVAIASALLIDAASGRTSLIAHIGTLIVLISVRYLASTRVRKNILLSTLLLSSLVFAFIPFGPQEFTFRGELWIYARENLFESFLFGHGSSDWVRSAYSSGISLNYSTHNIWLEALYVSGALGFIILLVTVTAQKHLWGGNFSHIQIGMFAWIVLSGLTEVPAFFARPYIVPGFLLLYFLTSLTEAEDTSELIRGKTSP